jgi:hypothetical protein
LHYRTIETPSSLSDMTRALLATDKGPVGNFPVARKKRKRKKKN